MNVFDEIERIADEAAASIGAMPPSETRTRCLVRIACLNAANTGIRHFAEQINPLAPAPAPITTNATLNTATAGTPISLPHEPRHAA